MKRFLKPDEIGTLQSLVGSRIVYIGGPYMPEYMAAADVVLVTESVSIEIFGEVDSLEFRGYLDDFAYFVIRKASDKLLSQTVKSGNTNKQFSGRRILEIKVLTEETVALLEGGQDWRDHSVVGIMFILDRGVLSISFLSHHMEVFNITELSDGDRLDAVEEVSLRFDEDALNTYKVARQILTLDELRALDS